MKVMLLGNDKMVPIICIFLVIIFSATFSYILLKREKKNEIVAISDELINEFKVNGKTGIKKYKNKTFQVIGEISKIATPEHPRHKKDESSAISLYEKHCYFIFYFDYDVTEQHLLKRGDKAIIQGSLKDFSKRMLIEDDYEKRADRWRYGQEETSFYIFKGSRIIDPEVSTN